MANSKHAHFRYNIMDYCFINRAFDFKELFNYLNERIEETYPGESVSVRTLRQDLKLFRDKKNGFGAPLPEKARILRYTDPEFSIAKRPLLEYENYLIDASQVLLERFENHPKYNKLSEALITFQEGNEGESKSKILYFDQNEEYKGIKWLKPLYLAVKKKEVLKITFKGFKDEESISYEFHPQILKQYNRRWFVFGINKDFKNPKWSIPLDERLIDIKILKNVTYEESKVDWDSFFRSMVGVRREANEIVRIVLKFYHGREHYFKTKPFIPDYEEFFDEDKEDQVWFEAIINKELIQQILSYGKDLEVLEPQFLRMQLKNQCFALTKIYDN